MLQLAGGVLFRIRGGFEIDDGTHGLEVAHAGFIHPADQRRWLTDKGWLFEINAAGHPVLLRD
ncbi:DUF4224 domain-containing protein [Laribacter hongkongensis]|uniref:DUF4224 domain-containing protein n=1 Tax=Laribacter hongkongensis TaxID=168471 RepID=UPI0028181658|nr:DUF4224 domain-containing protein [Laribacter hongkongensis]MCG9084773.1 DUF4224 domain-containing protein [Laribacter hongkongensis]